MDVHEVFEAVVVNLETLDGQLPLEGVRVELPHLVVVNVQFLQLLQIFQAVYLYDLVPRCLKDLEFA